jgi:hypothetical protein
MRYGLVLVGWVVGCGGSSTSEYEPSQLERARVSVDEELESDQRYDWVGTTKVEGADGVWEIRVSGVVMDVSTPTDADLAMLDGLVDAHVAVAPEPLSNELSLLVTDAEGALQYLLEPVEPGALTESHFGLGLVAPANDLGPASAGGWDLSLTSAWLLTDAGDVELLPGAPQEVAIDGLSYRAVLLSGFTSEFALDASVQCSGAAERLAFELTRVEPGTADLTPLLRNEELDPPVSECLNAP